MRKRLSIDYWQGFRTDSAPLIAVWENNIETVTRYIEDGWNVNEIIEVNEQEKITPIVLAVLKANYDMIDFLISHKAKLDCGRGHAMQYAIKLRNETLIRYLHKRGAKLTGVKGTKAYNSIIYRFQTTAERIRMFETLEDIGLSMKDYAGGALREIILDCPLEGRDDESLKFLLEHGADINFNKEDDSGSGDHTPLAIAAAYSDIELVKLLVEHGADVSMETDWGRPYQIALSENKFEMAQYIKELEDPSLHDVKAREQFAREKNMPDSLIALIREGEATITRESGEGEFDNEWRLLSITDIYEYNADGKKCIVLANCFDCSTGFLLLWNPRNKKICYWDTNMELYGVFASFDKFIENPFYYLDRFFTDEFLVNR